MTKVLACVDDEPHPVVGRLEAGPLDLAEPPRAGEGLFVLVTGENLSEGAVDRLRDIG